MEYIYDHAAYLPDVADFPECIEKKYPDGIKNIEYLYNKFTKSLDELNHKAFCNVIGELREKMDKYCPIGGEEKKIQSKQFTTLVKLSRHAMHLQKERRNRDDILTSEIYESLYEEGIYATVIDVDPIINMLKNDIEQLQQDKKPYPSTKMYNDGPLLDILNVQLSQIGALPALSKYYQMGNFKVIRVGLQVISPGDIHEHITAVTTKLQGLHFDPKNEVLKCIIYLNDVDKLTGAFGHIKKSHRWYFDPVQRLFARAANLNFLRNSIEREAALSYPSPYRTNALIGRFIPDDSESSRKLLDLETIYTSDMANCMIFDPANGLHRGGICEGKQRISLQVICGP